MRLITTKSDFVGHTQTKNLRMAVYGGCFGGLAGILLKTAACSNIKPAVNFIREPPQVMVWLSHWLKVCLVP